mgnify:CR=1 FL=1|tara:strand:- start:48052 stop:48597 length:546 start_codon:yes stop_codon:yes gene_type:complete
MKNLVTKYSDFIFEKKKSSLKGISSENIIKKIEAVMDVLPNDVQFGVPSDNLGQSTSYKSPGDAIQRIKDITHYYNKRKEDVKFYCWSITFKGDFNASQELEDKMEEADGLFHEDKAKYGKIDMIKVRDYVQTNPEDADEFKSFSISLDSASSRKFGMKLSSGTSNDKTKEKESEESEDEF